MGSGKWVDFQTDNPRGIRRLDSLPRCYASCVLCTASASLSWISAEVLYNLYLGFFGKIAGEGGVCCFWCVGRCDVIKCHETLRKTNIAPRNGGVSNRNLLFQGVYFQGGTLGFREGKWAGMSFASKVSHTWHPRVVFFVEIVTKSPFLMFGHGVKREFSMSQTWTKAFLDLFVNPSEQLGLPKDSVNQWCMQRVRKTVGIYGAKTISAGYIPTIKRVHDHFHQFLDRFLVLIRQSLKLILFPQGGPLRSLYTWLITTPINGLIKG